MAVQDLGVNLGDKLQRELADMTPDEARAVGASILNFVRAAESVPAGSSGADIAVAALLTPQRAYSPAADTALTEILLRSDSAQKL